MTGGRPDTGSGYFSLDAHNSGEVIGLGSGLLFTAGMKVKNGIYSGKYDFRLSSYVLSNKKSTGEPHQIWAPIYITETVEINAGTVGLPYSGGGISLSRSSVNSGGTFNVYVDVPAIQAAADTAYIRVDYDQYMFDLISWNPSITGGSGSYGSGYFSLYAANSSQVIDVSRGLTFTATMRTRNTDSSGNFRFRLSYGSLTFAKSNGYEHQEIWRPVNTNAYIAVNPTAVVTTRGSSNPNAVTTVRGAAENTRATTTTTRRTTTTSTLSGNPSDIVYYDDEDGDTTRPVYDDDPSDDEDDSGLWFDDDPGDDEQDSGGNAYIITGSSDKNNVTLQQDLKGLSKGSIRISAQSADFGGDTVIVMSNSDSTDTAARNALRDIGFDGAPFYAMDISLYDRSRSRYVHELENGGSITFRVPVPKLLANAQDIQVFHIDDGVAVPVGCEKERSGGVDVLVFSADTFSPYLIADIGYAGSGGFYYSDDDDDAQLITPAYTNMNTDPYDGNVNPATGAAAAAAVIIPSALTGCVLLAKKNVKRRKRSRKYVDDER